jgi:hypothetical protein
MDSVELSRYSYFILSLALFSASNRPPIKSGSGLERVKGIEPSYAVWQIAVLPLKRFLHHHIDLS